MNEEIEKDGFITRAEDTSKERRTCYNCRFYKYVLGYRTYKCMNGHVFNEPDWRQRYSVCDRWEK